MSKLYGVMDGDMGKLPKTIRATRHLEAALKFNTSGGNSEDGHFLVTLTHTGEGVDLTIAYDDDEQSGALLTVRKLFNERNFSVWSSGEGWKPRALGE